MKQVWKVSKEILQSSGKPIDDNYSQLLVEWGQYIDHDITFTPQTTSVDCLNTCESVHPCFSIKVDRSNNQILFDAYLDIVKYPFVVNVCRQVMPACLSIAPHRPVLLILALI